MQKAAIYVRKSKFTGKGESIQNQMDMCVKYAKDHGYDIDNNYIYHDEGFSGGNIDRPDFQNMIADVKKNKFQVLICYRLDRVSRSISDFSNTLELLNDNDVAFVSIKEQFDTSTPMGRAMMYIASVFAQLERETIAERIKDNMLQLAKTGRWLGGECPTGFKSEPVVYLDNDMKEKKMFKLSPIPKQLKLIRLIYKLYLDIGSLSGVENYCLQHHVKTKNDKDFTRLAIKNILLNPVYAIADKSLYNFFKDNNCIISNDISEFNGKHAVLVYNKTINKKNKSVKYKNTEEWIVAIAKHQGIIKSDDWIKVQQIIRKNRTKAPRQGTSSQGLLSGLVRCSNCGSIMRVKSGRNNSYYYLCTMKEHSCGKRCNIENLPGNKTDEYVTQYIINLFKNPNDIIKNILELNKDFKDNESNTNKDANYIKVKIKENENTINQLVTQLSKNKESTASTYIINTIESLDAEIKALKKSLNTHNKKLNNIKDNKFKLDLLNNFLTNYSFLNTDNKEDKKKLFRLIISNIQWDGTNLKINLFGTTTRKKSP